MTQQYNIVCVCSFKDETDNSYVEYNIKKTINAASDRAAMQLASNWVRENQSANNSLYDLDDWHVFNLDKGTLVNSSLLYEQTTEEQAQ